MTRWHNSVPWFGLFILAIGSVLLIVGGVSGVWIAGVAGGMMIGTVFGYWIGHGDAEIKALERESKRRLTDLVDRIQAERMKP